MRGCGTTPPAQPPRPHNHPARTTSPPAQPPRPHPASSCAIPIRPALLSTRPVPHPLSLFPARGPLRSTRFFFVCLCAGTGRWDVCSWPGRIRGHAAAEAAGDRASRPGRRRRGALYHVAAAGCPLPSLWVRRVGEELLGAWSVPFTTFKWLPCRLSFPGLAHSLTPRFALLAAFLSPVSPIPLTPRPALLAAFLSRSRPFP